MFWLMLLHKMSTQTFFTVEFLDEGIDKYLIEVLSAAIKQAATGDTPVGRYHGKRGAVQKDFRQIQEERNRISEVLIPALPRLLRKVNMILSYLI
jgi:hypothetical protein